MLVIVFVLLSISVVSICKLVPFEQYLLFPAKLKVFTSTPGVHTWRSRLAYIGCMK